MVGHWFWGRCFLLCLVGCGGVLPGCGSVRSTPDVSEWVEQCSVRVRRGHVCGSGTVFASDRGRVLVLTNAHVVGDDVGATCKVELFARGVRSVPISGEVVAVAYDNRSALDLAVVSLRTVELGSYRPPAIPLADRLLPLPVRSRGCPGCDWPSEFCGHLLRVRSGTFSFLPEPQPGRSGSGVVQVINGEPRLVGVVTWAASGPDAKEGYGIAQSIDTIRSVLNGVAPRSTRGAEWVPVSCDDSAECVVFSQEVQPGFVGWSDVTTETSGPCGPGGCGPDGCGIFGDGAFSNVPPIESSLWSGFVDGWLRPLVPICCLVGVCVLVVILVRVLVRLDRSLGVRSDVGDRSRLRFDDHSEFDGASGRSESFSRDESAVGRDHADELDPPVRRARRKRGV